jgi:WD40 repeat protein
MAEIEVPSGAKKIRNLTLISLGISAVLWLLWGFVGLRGTPCSWAARIKSSECVRIISRDVRVGAEKVSFSKDDTQILFLDHASIRIELVRKKSLFDAGKSIPLISVEHLDRSLGRLDRIVGFALSSDEKLAAICALYDTGSGYDPKLMLTELDHPGGAHVIFPDVYCRYSDMNFISSSVLVLNSFEGTQNKVLFLDIKDNSVRSVPGDYLPSDSDNSEVLPVRAEKRLISLYSLPGLEKLDDLAFPSHVWGARISPDSRYIFANSDQDAVIYVMDRSSGQLAYTFSDEIYSDSSVFAVSPNGAFLAAAFSDYDGPVSDGHSILYILDLKAKRVVKTIAFDRTSLIPRYLDFSSDGKLLAIGTWRYVMILDLTK